MSRLVYLLVIVLFGLFSSGISEDIRGNDVANSVQKVQKAIEAATKAYDERVRLLTVNGAQSGKSHSRGPIKSTKKTQAIGRISAIYRNAFKELTSKDKMERKLALKLLGEVLPAECPATPVECDEGSKYRTVDGTCNNLENPTWGSTDIPLRRLLDPEYKGENDEPRGGFDGGDLPPPRKVTLALHTGSGQSFESNITNLVSQYGQFLDHTITLTPVDNLRCCENPELSENCWKIAVDPNDEFYNGRLECLDFVRSTPACFPSPGRDHREQFNDITAFIDGSMVYGSDNETFHLLRSHQNGKLKENSEHPGFLPWKSDVIENGDKSVIAGDVRANEMPGLTVMHVLFLREHNRIAEQLSTLRPDWDDERLFQETRRIVGAELQQITYQEYLPAILGDKAMKDYDLQLPLDPTSYTTYDPKVDPTIFNSFATAAYRFGHTLVNGLIQLFMEDRIVGDYQVRDNYLISDQVIGVHEGTSGYNLILNGLFRQRSQAFDREIHEDMTNYLFMNKATKIGEDLAARNIQRGRDHGIPSYNKFREYCKLPPLTSWEDRSSDIDETTWRKLATVYKTPDDIDLYTGGLSEIPVPTALSGPTFVCLQGEQFRSLKNGDRFFFTHGGNSGTFTPKQLAQLRKRTLGDIICENSDIKEVPRSVFYLTSQLNPMLPCEGRTLDISVFAEDDDGTTSTTPQDSTTPGGSSMSLYSGYFISASIFFTLFFPLR